MARTTVRSGPLLEAEQQGGEVALVARVEVERRLVEHQQLGFLGQGGGDEDGLALAARELVDRPSAQLFDPHHPEGLVDGGEVFRARRELEGGEVRVAPEEDDLLDLERHPGGADLRHIGDAAGDLAAGERGEGAAAVGDLAAGRLQQSGEATEKGRLAGAVGSHQGQALAAKDLEIEGPQDGSRTGAPGELACAEQDGWGQCESLAPRARSRTSRISR